MEEVGLVYEVCCSILKPKVDGMVRYWLVQGHLLLVLMLAYLRVHQEAKLHVLAGEKLGAVHSLGHARTVKVAVVAP